MLMWSLWSPRTPSRRWKSIAPPYLQHEKCNKCGEFQLTPTVLEDLGKIAEFVFVATTAFTSDEADSCDNQITINTIPEPTTATLSLQALSGLAMRRRQGGMRF